MEKPLFEQIFASELTEEIKDLAKRRLLEGGNLGARGCDRRKAKLALLVVIQINPRETLTSGEAAVLYGVSENTLRIRKLGGEL